MSAKERILTIRLMDKAIRSPATAEKLCNHIGLKVNEFNDKMIGKGRSGSHV